MAEREILGTTGKIRFDVTQEHRTGGNGATYILENYKKAVEHPEFQQAIEMGNAYGYHGHPTRKVLENGKLVDKPVLFPKEHEAMPTHVCIFAEMDGKNCIHEEAFLTPSGKDVHGLWNGRTGGFSSRASTIGGYGGRFYPTKLSRMAGFDFVHDRSYRYNSFEGVIATEAVMPELTLEYLIDELGIEDKTAHFVCNGGFCPKPGELALEQAVFLQIMEHELALEEVFMKDKEAEHEIGFKNGFKSGLDESLENEKRDFSDQIEEFQETFKENREKELIEAEKIAIECVRRMPRKPHLEDGFYKAIAPALIKNGTEETAIESVFYELIKPFTGYTLADFSEPKDEYVNVNTPQERQPPFFKSQDRFLVPHN